MIIMQIKRMKLSSKAISALQFDKVKAFVFDKWNATYICTSLAHFIRISM